MRPRHPASSRWWDERGQAGGIEVVPFGVLVFVAGALMIFNLWAVVDAKDAAEAAAREGARAVVELSSLEVDTADRAARARVTDLLDGWGLDPAHATTTVVAPELRRCAPIQVEVTYPVPYIRLPFLGEFGEAFRVVGRHGEVIDPYRAGLPVGGGDPCG